MLVECNKRSKIGVLKNANFPSLKPVKVGNVNIILANTCSFDAPCQLFVTALTDSCRYRTEMVNYNTVNSILDVAKHVSLSGVTQVAYKRRTTALLNVLKPQDLVGGAKKIDCVMDSSALLRLLNIIPSVTETYTCSSTFCSKSVQENTVKVISATTTGEDFPLKNLEAVINASEPERLTPCYQPMSHIKDVPQEFYLNNADLSKKVSRFNLNFS